MGMVIIFYALVGMTLSYKNYYQVLEDFKKSNGRAKNTEIEDLEREYVKLQRTLSYARQQAL